ncbi:MAG: FAD-binding oxidoreductase [Acidobacteria bacterium]|nr:FAD-binding oxidoreductase [Acidobacteriota bacterium]
MSVFRSELEGPPSLWLRRRPLRRRVPFAVVGGGLVGLSTAYWLKKAGKEVLLLEAEHVGGRASGRNAGFLLTGSAEPFQRLAKQIGRERALAFWHKTAENRELLRRELLDRGPGARGGIDCDFLPEGSWIAAVDDRAKVEELQESGQELRSEGLDLAWVEGAALAEASGSRRLGGAIYQPRDGGLHPVKLTQGMVEAGGIEVLTGSRVRELDATAGGGVRMACDAGDVEADRALLALNAYIPSLIPQLAADVRPIRGQMFATEPLPRTLKGVWYIDDGFQYLRQLGDGTLVLGGCRNVAFEEEVGYSEQPSRRVQEALEAFLHEFFPGFSGGAVAHRWAGTMGFSDDGLPLIGPVPHLPGALYAAGLTGHGLSLSFVLGRYLARRLTGETEEPFLPPAE